MNVDRIINMVIRQIMRRFINKGMNAGLNAVSGRSKKNTQDVDHSGLSQAPASKEAQDTQALAAKKAAKRARQSVRLGRKL